VAERRSRVVLIATTLEVDAGEWNELPPRTELMGLAGFARRQLRRLPAPVKNLLRSARHPGQALGLRRRRAETITFVRTVASYCNGIRGKRVLEVGSDGEGMLILEAERQFEPQEIIGINPAFPGRVLGPRSRLELVDVRSTPYSDDSFDLIVSSSAFEHIHELDRALAEMFRILKSGGYLFSHFGPIWSTSYGHHLWLMEDGRLYNYWNTPLPPYCHLLMPPAALAQHCRKRYGERLGPRISDYVYNSPEQNRLFYEDYERVVAASAFEVCVFKGYDHAELAARYLPENLPDVLDNLKRKFPGRSHFGYDGITLLLRKA